MERLTPLAATFLEAEDVDPNAALAIGSFMVFEGPVPQFEEFVESIRGRLPLIPRYRQRLRTTPLQLAAPYWVDDPNFDVRWHVRNTALPAPGGREEIGRLMSRVMTTRMNRERPLWEYWFVTGLPEGRWALLSKLHHCLADGVSGTDLYRLVLDLAPTPTPPPPDDWSPAPMPGTLEVTARAAWDVVSSPVAAVRSAAAGLSTPGDLVRRTAASTRGLLSLSGALKPIEPSSLTGILDGTRRYDWVTVSLPELKAVRKAFGVTVNDVALAVISGGFRQLLLSRGEEPSPHALRSLVPVSSRAPGTESITDNRVTLMLPYLPVDIASATDRLRAVSDRVHSLRAQHEPEAGVSVTSAAEYGPFGPVAWAIRTALRVPQRSVSTVTTNVPGPPVTLYGLGREALEVYPYVPIADRVRIGVAMFSYRDTFTFGLTGDFPSTPDLHVLAEGIASSLEELVDLAESAATS